MPVIQWILIIIVGYLLGSLPNAYLVTLAVKRINIFEVGSGNMGGTNVARTLGLRWGIFTAFLDSAKGMLAVVLAQLIAGYAITIIPPLSMGLSTELLIPSMLGALSAVAGHNWSLFATGLYVYYQKKFEIRGGKGAATAYGTTIMMLPFMFNIILIVIGVAIAYTTRYASLSVLVSYAVTYTLVIVWTVITPAVSSFHMLFIVLLAVLIVWRFRENIERLATGTERRLGERVQTS